MRNLDEFNGKHTGKVCFVIGSGPSLSFHDLSGLDDFYSIAVNSGYVACPGADYFLSDDWSVARWSYFFEDLRRSKNTIALLYEDMLINQAKLFKKRSVLFRHRHGYHITDKYEHEDSENRICQARTSVGSAIHVAHIMGFSKIVLLGIDCCRDPGGRRYFWTNKPGRKPYRNDNVLVDHYHRVRSAGVDSDTDLVAITEYWEKAGLEFNKKCDIYNASPFTILKVFPQVSLPEFIKDNQEGKK